MENYHQNFKSSFPWGTVGEEEEAAVVATADVAESATEKMEGEVGVLGNWL